ncbi:DUF3718 domain-containing protein [Aliiglaciecola sp. CAU 1673]|uniref:DUF3718 domain-containing protein n=1 Tax=Aliiglaciecola sp. CAU 1673 TaxID=3032595 RepID=UPI0023DBF73A|nr:DUF3718 domain-containing protein [Aliiglaciecola sp. CAU 1673]MDF2176717.1 DUF3718 domain-containing protein [Aliiglaciecola sp. CAU 1673]
MFNYRTLAIATTLMAAPLMSQAATYEAADQSVASRLCVSAVTQNTIGFITAVDQSGYKLTYIARNLHCNDEPVAYFAADAGQDMIAARLERLMVSPGRTEIKDVVAVPSSKPLSGQVLIAPK